MIDNTKNKAIDLHNILFSQLEKLADDDLETKEQVEIELKRTKGICDISKQLLNLASLQMRANELVDKQAIFNDDKPRLLS